MQRRIHFVGVGGIGISALAQYYQSSGSRVSGCDAAPSEITRDLTKRGVRILSGHGGAGHLSGVSRLIYSAAIPQNYPELVAARRQEIETLSYAEALGELTKQYYTIAISGSHGKSTTTALVSLILVAAGLDPTVIIGTKLREFGENNFRRGRSRYLVIEADEWNRSFHKYHPDLIILTNIDKEHLDTYKTFAGVVGGFRAYVRNLKSGGTLIGNGRDKNVVRIAKRIGKQAILFNRLKTARHHLKIPGVHNQWNAEAAWQAVKFLGVRKGIADRIFKNYNGAWRRLEQLYPDRKKIRATLYTDYAHHPTEIKATLAALRERHPRQKVICVFEPHQQERLNRLFKEFTSAFNGADRTIILPLYLVKGREYRAGKTSEDLVRAITKPHISYAKNLSQALSLLKSELGNQRSVIAFMGAGNLDAVVRKKI